MTPIDFGKSFLFSFFNKRRAPACAEKLAEDSVLVLPGAARHVRTRTEGETFLRERMMADPVRGYVDIASIWSAPAASGICSVSYEISVVSSAEGRGRSYFCSLVISDREGGQEITAVHISENGETELDRSLLTAAACDRLPCGTAILHQTGSDLPDRALFNRFFIRRLGYTEEAFDSALKADPLFMIWPGEENKLRAILDPRQDMEKLNICSLGFKDAEGRRMRCRLHVRAEADRDGGRLWYIVLLETGGFEKMILQLQAQADLSGEVLRFVPGVLSLLRLSEGRFETLYAGRRVPALCGMSRAEYMKAAADDPFTCLEMTDITRQRILDTHVLEKPADPDCGMFRLTGKGKKPVWTALYVDSSLAENGRDRLVFICCLDRDAAYTEVLRESERAGAAIRAEQKKARQDLEEMGRKAAERLAGTERKASEDLARRDREIADLRRENRRLALEIQDQKKAFEESAQALLARCRKEAADREAELTEAFDVQQEKLRQELTILQEAQTRRDGAAPSDRARYKKAELEIAGRQMDRARDRLLYIMEQDAGLFGVSNAVRPQNGEQIRDEILRDFSAMAAEYTEAEAESAFVLTEAVRNVMLYQSIRAAERGITLVLREQVKYRGQVRGRKALLQTAICSALDGVLSAEPDGGSVTLVLTSERPARGRVKAGIRVAYTGGSFTPADIASLWNADEAAGDRAREILYAARTTISALGGTLRVDAAGAEVLIRLTLGS